MSISRGLLSNCLKVPIESWMAAHLSIVPFPGKLWDFGQVLTELAEQAELYKCIQEYPDSVDRTDEDEDSDFKVRRPYKVRR